LRAAQGAADVVGAIKEGFDRATALASPQEAARWEGTKDIIGAKVGEAFLPLKRGITDMVQDVVLGKRLYSLTGLPPAVMGSVEQVSMQMTQRTLNLGGNSVEAELLRMQLKNIRDSGGLLERIERNTRDFAPAFRG
jgi:hypothetical protein